MTKRDKTPTLAQLRKLAKRKGYTFDRSWYEYRLECDSDASPDMGFIYGVGDRFSRSVIFAALSALPDKPKGAKR